MKPTVGRIVWYGGGEKDALRLSAAGEPLAALVVKVVDDKTVNLQVFEPEGPMHFVANVPIHCDGDLLDQSKPFCTWPLIGPPKKDEAAGNKVDDIEAVVKVIDEHVAALGEQFDKLANRVAAIETACDGGSGTKVAIDTLGTRIRALEVLGSIKDQPEDQHAGEKRSPEKGPKR